MQATQTQKTPGKVIPLRRFETTPDEAEAKAKRPDYSKRREEYLSQQILVTLKKLLESLRPLKT